MQPLTKGRSIITRYLIDSTRKYGDLDCMQYLKRGDYVGITWKEVFEVTRLFSLGFQALGVNPQDRIALMSHTRYEWRLVDYGIMFAGATTVTIYPSLTAAQVEYILNDSNCSIIIVDSPRNLRKVQAVRENCPNLKYVFIIEPMGNERPPNVLGLDNLIEKGKSLDIDLSKLNSEVQKKAKKISGEIEDWTHKIAKSYDEAEIGDLLEQTYALDVELAEITKDAFTERYLGIKDEDICTIVYTSGTTGVPKGALLTHYNMAKNAQQTIAVMPLQPHDVALSFLPLSHVLERQVGQFMATLVGFTVAYARDTDSLIENLDQVQPTFIVSVPRIYEKLYDRIIADVMGGNETKQKIFDHAVEWGLDYQTTIQAKEEVPIKLAIKNWFGDKLVFKKIHDILGGRLRFMFSGGAAINPILARFFFAAGFKIMEGYGLTETSPVLTINRLEDIRFGTVGPPIPETEIKIAEDGEICAKGPQVFQGYWNKLEENASAFDSEGWYCTGDTGTIDKDGYLKITGRKKTVIVLRTGKKVSPIITEAALQIDRHVAHACVIGDDLKYLIGIIEPNFEYLGEWLEEHNLTPWKPEDLEVHKGMTKEEFQEVMNRRKDIIAMPEVVDFYNKIFTDSQQNLSEFERVRRFALVPDDWNEYNVLTPSMKMKRADIKTMYKDLIDATYIE